MKKFYFIFALLLMVAGVQTIQAQYGIRLWRGSGYEQKRVEEVDSITFVKFVQSIEISPLTLELQVGETAQLDVAILPEDATDKTLSWQASACVSVSPTGLVTANFSGIAIIRCVAGDGSGVASATCQVTVTKPGGGDPDEHEYIDLGLPSGTLWATCNVGATSPEAFGEHYAWGETLPKYEFTQENYLFYDESVDGQITKYNDIDGLTELVPEDDAATANWGSDWQMPSKEQYEELIDANFTTVTYTGLNDVYGYLITSNSNGKSLFFPDAGYYLPDGYHDWGGFYWARTIGWNGYSGCNLFTGVPEVEISEQRWYGFSVRPVRKP